ncbi:ATPase [Devosia pacifica]|uniref:ATPase n=1 Tax=Devosia pacifica TaxID=1335967 RepID=A0A918S263_9HYPH|nr:AAA family ATPase [Devosia pacifica]GHA17410.1 ATPase [Devosia pacifica]
MSLTVIDICGYRSVKSLRFPVRRVSVYVGGNAVGKTNLYRALELVHHAATGALAREIGKEGGLASIFWAGPRRRDQIPRITLEVFLESVLGHENTPFSPRYRIEIGFPDVIQHAAFDQEAQVKTEQLSIVTAGGRSVTLLERKGRSVWARDADGRKILLEHELLASETALSQIRGGGVFAEIEAVRHTLSSWRFYHQFRTDPDAPIRRPGLPVTSPLLDADGSNLASVLATLRHIRGDTVDLDDAIDAAFPGAQLVIDPPTDRAQFSMRFPDLPHRIFAARELSEGTLQFLALLGALLSYRLPPLIALNEPEASLHPDLLPALAKAIAQAAKRSQIWVVTHSRPLADAIELETGAAAREVIRDDGATTLRGLGKLGTFVDDI